MKIKMIDSETVMDNIRMAFEAMLVFRPDMMDKCTFYGLYDDTGIQAMAAYSDVGEDGQQGHWLHAIVVRTETRNKGYGRALLNHVQVTHGDLNIHPVTPGGEALSKYCRGEIYYGI